MKTLANLSFPPLLHFLSNTSSTTSVNLIPLQSSIQTSALTIRSSFTVEFRRGRIKMESTTSHGNTAEVVSFEDESIFERFVDVGNELMEASGSVIQKYFRKSIDILDKDDLSRCKYMILLISFYP